MTAFGSHSPIGLAAIPPTQNTAPVLEFRCLYTSDLRRKQKRWSDGRLKYHTFNKRVMVYDERSNYVGDTHWREDNNLAEGDELELERGGIIVEVADCIGRRDQDLTDLLDKRAKEKEGRAAAKASVSRPSPLRMPITVGNQARAPSTIVRLQVYGSGGANARHLTPKPLNSLLGIPSGHYGRAVAPKSPPLEERRSLVNIRENNYERIPKRRKLDPPHAKNGYAQQLTGTSLTLSGRPISTAPLRLDAMMARNSRVYREVETVDLTGTSKENIVLPSETARVRMTHREMTKRSPSSSGYAQKMTGATLILNARPPVSLIQMFMGRMEQGQLERGWVNGTQGEQAEMVEKFLDIEDLEVQHDSRSCKAEFVESSVKRSSLRSHRPNDIISEHITRPVVPSDPTIQQSTPQPPTTVEEPQTEFLEHQQKPLRIKSRPKKKMLYMARSQSLPSTNLEKRPIQSYAAQGYQISGDPPLSQATVQLDAFAKAQKQRLQARMDGKPDGAFQGERMPSGAEDAGIDHRTVETILLRKPLQLPAVNSTTLKQADKWMASTEDNITVPQISNRGTTQGLGSAKNNSGKLQVAGRPSSGYQNPDSGGAVIENTTTLVQYDAISAVSNSSDISFENFGQGALARPQSTLPHGPVSTDERHFSMLKGDPKYAGVRAAPVQNSSQKSPGTKMSLSERVVARPLDIDMQETIPCGDASSAPMQAESVPTEQTSYGVPKSDSAGTPLLQRGNLSMNHAGGTAKIDMKSDDAYVVLEQPTPCLGNTSHARLANPATRGKKAAKAADKAGILPETRLGTSFPMGPSNIPLHFEHDLQTMTGFGMKSLAVPRFPTTDILTATSGRHETLGVTMQSRTEAAPNELIRYDQEFGPWSREASDLLDWTRKASPEDSSVG